MFYSETDKETSTSSEEDEEEKSPARKDKRVAKHEVVVEKKSSLRKTASKHERQSGSADETEKHIKKPRDESKFFLTNCKICLFF